MNDLQISSNTSLAVSSATYPQTVLDAAAGVLENCYNDYYFIQFDSDEYLLIVGDIEFNGLSCSSDNFDAYVFQAVDVSSAQTYTIPFSGSSSGSQSGGYGGSDGTGGYNGSNSGTVSGNSTLSIVTEKKYNILFDYVHQPGEITISNTNSFLCYGSADYMPHLVEGVQSYAFAAFCLACGVIGFRLADRIFQRIY